MADKALLMGVNNYKYISPLRGCVNDVNNMSRLLTETYGFAEGQIHKLIDRQVTGKKVEQELKWLFEDVSPGDRVVLHFAGHGSYTVDLDGDDEHGKDELLCLYDMDWNDPNSYLLDDQLRDWTQKLPKGVQLTVLLDNCHSGTGTRQIRPPGSDAPESELPWVDLEASVARSVSQRGGSRSLGGGDVRSLVQEALKEQEHEVIARFVQPPPEIVARAARAARGRSRTTPRTTSQMNHVLLAACRDDQTAADARINNDFNGAFTYHLCETIRRAGGRIEHRQLISELQQTLRSGSFSQVPQLEPDSASGIFLSDRRSIQPSVDASPLTPGTLPPDHPDHLDEANSLETLLGTAASPDNERLRLQLLHKLVDLVGCQLPGNDRPSSQWLGGLASGRATGTRVIVYVHGICRHEEGFSNAWWQALAPFAPSLGRGTLNTSRREVLWSDIVNRRSITALAAGETAEVEDVSQQLRATLEDRLLREMAEAEGTDRSLDLGVAVPAEERGVPGFDCIDDFSRYLVNRDVRRQVMDRFHAVVRPLLSAGTQLQIIGHSWGTVVAYEALRELDDATYPGRVRNFFTVGSALSIPTIKRSLLAHARDGRRPRLVDRWINVDARGDVVGGLLKGQPYAVDEEFLNCDPVGCSRFLGLINPKCAHGSYFNADNQAVNRDIFGRFIERP